MRFPPICFSLVLALAAQSQTVVEGADAKRDLPGWGTIVDPDNDCTFEATPKKLTLTVPPMTHNLHPAYAMNAPRVVRKVNGDFTIQVKVTSDLNPTRFFGAGILLWESEECYFRVERNAFLNGDESNCYPPLIEYWKDKKYSGFNEPADSSEYFVGRSTWFRVERKGKSITVTISHDGTTWKEVKTVEVDMAPELSIGVDAVSVSTTPFKVVFEDLIVKESKSAEKAPLVKSNIPYADPALERQLLDVYAPENARNLPVVFWIHGGGWQSGDKTLVQLKPKTFVDKGLVFVSTNYRLLPNVDMETIISDVAKSVHWVHDHIAEYGGDPNRVFVMGHSAGAQLAAIICTDEHYLKSEGLSLDFIKGCVPVDGDTYDIPMMIEAGRAKRKALGQPEPKFGHFEKFGNDPVKHRNFSAVNHVARNKGIPPFLLLHVADHPDTTAQAQRLGTVLTEAGLSAKVYGAKDTEHSKINENIGTPDDPTTKVLIDFVDEALKK